MFKQILLRGLQYLQNFHEVTKLFSINRSMFTLIFYFFVLKYAVNHMMTTRRNKSLGIETGI